IECSFGRRATNSWNCVEPLAHQLAASLEFFPHGFNTALIAVKRRQSRILTDARWIAGFLALNVAHRLNDVQGAKRPPHTPSRHRIALADSANGNGSLRQFRIQSGETSRLSIAENKLLVNLIAEDGEIAVQDHLAKRFQLLP